MRDLVHCAACRRVAPSSHPLPRAWPIWRSEVEAVVDGHAWTQQPFPYQAKCLQWLRQSRVDLEAGARERVDSVLATTGCMALFA